MSWFLGGLLRYVSIPVFSGLYSENKIDLVELDKHIKRLNAAIIKAEPFISHQGYLQLIKVRDTLNKLLTVRDLGASLSGEEYVAFIMELEKPMNTARDVLRDELKLDELGILQNDKSKLSFWISLLLRKLSPGA